jgi:hypothetical protein
MVPISKTVLKAHLLELEKAVKSTGQEQRYGEWGDVIRRWLDSCRGEAVTVENVAQAINRPSDSKFLESVLGEAYNNHGSDTLEDKMATIVLVAILVRYL